MLVEGWGIQRRGYHWTSPGLHKTKFHSPLNTTHSRVGPQQLGWMAQSDFPRGKGAENASYINWFGPQGPA